MLILGPDNSAAGPSVLTVLVTLIKRLSSPFRLICIRKLGIGSSLAARWRQSVGTFSWRAKRSRISRSRGLSLNKVRCSNDIKITESVSSQALTKVPAPSRLNRKSKLLFTLSRTALLMVWLNSPTQPRLTINMLFDSFNTIVG